MSNRPTVIFRADGNRDIGSGHIMRCSSIASALDSLGARAIFAVSDDASASMARVQGLDARVLGGEARCLGADDAARLADLARAEGATAILIDTYAVTDAFFTALRTALARRFAPPCPAPPRICLIDDAFTFADGATTRPVVRDVDVVVNYSLDFSVCDYVTFTEAGGTALVGPSFAPLRPEFASAGFEVGDEVRRVLVTCGSTNPARVLEKMAQTVLRTLPDAHLDVVVGMNATFAGDACRTSRVTLHDNPSHMASLMSAADLAVSAAGTTVYELIAVGTPSIVFPLVDNQRRNAREFAQAGLGMALRGPDDLGEPLACALRSLACGEEGLRRRATFSGAMREISGGGTGALRVARVLVGGK